jgi:hypothetical protein
MSDQHQLLVDDGSGNRQCAVRGEEAERELIHALVVLTAALNQVRVRREHRSGGLVRWALPKVIDERNRISDDLALRRSR